MLQKTKYSFLHLIKVLNYLALNDQIALKTTLKIVTNLRMYQQY